MRSGYQVLLVQKVSFCLHEDDVNSGTLSKESPNMISKENLT